MEFKPVIAEADQAGGDALREGSELGDGQVRPSGPSNPDLAGRSTVAMQLNGSGVNFKIDTAVDHSIAIVSLTAKLELALEMLSETSRRLDLSQMRVGQLEAELAASRDFADCVNVDVSSRAEV